MKRFKFSLFLLVFFSMQVQVSWAMITVDALKLIFVEDYENDKENFDVLFIAFSDFQAHQRLLGVPMTSEDHIEKRFLALMFNKKNLFIEGGGYFKGVNYGYTYDDWVRVFKLVRAQPTEKIYSVLVLIEKDPGNQPIFDQIRACLESK